MAAVINGPYGKHTLREGYSLLGRGDDCDIRLDDPRLSRSHARFFWCEGRLQIEDMGSHNGILVNGEVVHGLSNLFHGNLIAIGPAVYDVSIDEHADEKLASYVQSVPKPDSASFTQQNPRSPTEQASVRKTTEFQDHDDEPISGILPSNGYNTGRQALTSRRESSAAQNQTGHKENLASTISDTYYSPDEADEHHISAVRAAGDDSTVIREIQAHAIVDAKTQAHERERMNDLLPKESIIANVHTATIHSRLKASRVYCHGIFIIRRSCAALLDCLHIITLCIMLSAPILFTGYYMALSQNSASMQQSLPTFDLQAESLPWTEVALSLTNTEGWQRAWKLSGEVYELFPDSFVWIFSSIAIALLLITLCLLFTLVSATTIKGAPFWHRKLHLIIVEKQNGFYPTPLRSCARWGLCILLAPLALLSCLINARSLHDYFSGCEVKANKD